MSRQAGLVFAQNLCMVIEQIAPSYGAHVALTGGTLYKHGERKDVDILFYRIRQVSEIDRAGLTEALAKAGFSDMKHYGWITKAKYDGRCIDIFFPETPQGEDDDLYDEYDEGNA